MHARFGYAAAILFEFVAAMSGMPFAVLHMPIGSEVGQAMEGGGIVRSTAAERHIAARIAAPGFGGRYSSFTKPTDRK